MTSAAGTAQQPPSSDYAITSRQIPPEYKTAAEFLDYLKPTKESPAGFDLKVTPKWDITRLMSFVSNDGISFSDVNRGRSAGKLSVKQIDAAVRIRKGRAFRAFAHLGYIYAQPYKQYSELKFEPQPGGVVVRVADWYKLTFVGQGDQLKLTRIDYLRQET